MVRTSPFDDAFLEFRPLGQGGPNRARDNLGVSYPKRCSRHSPEMVSSIISFHSLLNDYIVSNIINLYLIRLPLSFDTKIVGVFGKLEISM